MKYTVTAQVTISIHTNVEADSEADALAKADERMMCRFCHQCGGDPDCEWATSGELDGEATNMVIDEPFR